MESPLLGTTTKKASFLQQSACNAKDVTVITIVEKVLGFASCFQRPNSPSGGKTPISVSHN